jgi:site-specific recombinase XerD
MSESPSSLVPRTDAGATPATRPGSLLVAAPEPGHALGPVQDDWDAARVWLDAVARKSRASTTSTLDTYRFHLAKLRWYCENVLQITPSRWSMQEVEHFYAFLEELPEDALCGMEGERYARDGEPGHTPFRKQPSPSSQSDIRRFVHALFRAWHSMGYIRINPMALTGARTARKLQTERSLSQDFLACVIEAIKTQEVTTYAERQRQMRDLFIFVAFSELGLRASELVGSTMGSLYKLTNPANGHRYWIFKVSAECAKGGRERRIPVTRALMEAFSAYRESFGLPSVPTLGETCPLLLSTRTQAMTIGRQPVKSVSDRRFFGAWMPVTTRQGLFKIVKSRLRQAADRLDAAGEPDAAKQIESASPHWLRHTFAKAALLKGSSMREVAAMLGHASIDTTMIYTEQDALDLVTSLERTTPETLAMEMSIHVSK